MSSRLEELFFKLRLPKNREDQDILEFLKCERTYLVNELTSITNNMSDSFRHELYEKLKNTIPLVEKQFNLVFNIITNYEINKNLSMQYLEQLINNIDNFFYKKYLIQNSFECFTRIRYGEEFALTRSELFHPPFPKSIDYGRYSTPNIHTLYLTNNINLAWYECDLPNVFAYTEIIPADTLTIFRLNLCPYKEVFSQLICYQNRYKNTDNLDKIEQDICNYLAFYPLFISCSLSVSKKDCDTYPKEYFISNLLIEWIQKSETIDGISYYPCSFYSIGREYGINYAFPTKTNTKKYCAILSDKFLLKEPKRMKFQLDATQDVLICTEALNNLTQYQGFSNKLDNFIMYCYTLKKSLQLIEKNNTIPLDYLQSIFRSLHAIFEDYDLLCEYIANELTKKITSKKLPYNSDQIMSEYRTHLDKIKNLLQCYYYLFDYCDSASESDNSFEKVENEDLTTGY